MRGSNNLDSKKNLLNTIANVDSAGRLADVRDAIAKPLGIENPKKTIGKF